MMLIQSLSDIFKAAWRTPVIAPIPEGITGCMQCRDAAPWGEYSHECAHHRNKRASREWNERLHGGLS